MRLAFLPMLSLAGLLLVVSLSGRAVGQGQDASKERNPAEANAAAKVTIGKQTTRIEGPLRADGRVDYSQALDAKLSAGVTVENNAAAVVYTNIRLEGGFYDLPERPVFYRLLGIEAPTPDREPYTDTAQFIKRNAMGGDEALEKFAIHFSLELDAADRAPWSTKQHPEVALWLAGNDRALDDIVAGLERPRFYVPLVSPEAGDYALAQTLIPAVQPTRDLGKGIVARAMLRLGSDDVDGALRDLTACHRLARHVGTGATLIECLVAIAIDRCATAGDLTAARSGKLSADQLRGYAAELAKLPKAFDAAGKFDLGERYILLDALVSLAETGAGGVSGLHDLLDVEAPLLPLLERGVPNAAIDFDESLRAFNRQCDKLIVAGRKTPYAERMKAVRQWSEELKRLSEANGDTDAALARIALAKEPRAEFGRLVGELLMANMAPGIGSAVNAETRQLTHVELTRVALLLEAYRAEHDDYPESLARLTPKYVDKLPRDLYSNGEPIYRRDGDGYVLYSVGPNGRDDGSVPAGDEVDDVQLPAS